MLASLGVIYRFHLLWVIACMTDKGLADVRPIPVAPMPDADVPPDWVRCRFGSLEFSLPPDFTKNFETRNDLAMLAFHGNSLSMIVNLPTDGSDMADWLRTTWGLPPQGQSLSSVRLRLACRTADPNEFHWIMSPAEVQWLAWRVGVGRLASLPSFGSDRRAETFFQDDLEGVAYFTGKVVEFDWQAKDREIGSPIQFVSRTSDSPVDPNLVRAFCHSLKFSGKSYPRKLPEAQVLAEFQILTK